MTEQRANEIFRTKYPEGEIVRKNASSAGSRYFVTFKKYGKAYYYGATSYQELLGRFGFDIAYGHNIETAKAEIERHEKAIEDAKNGKFSMLWLGAKTKEEKQQKAIEFHTTELNKWKEELRYLTEDCIID